MNQSIKSVIQELCKKHNITFEQGREIYYDQFKMVREAISEGDKNDIESFKNIGLPNFGKFAFDEAKYNKINECSNKKKK
jgi:nucleoid DNA-binding protein